METESISIQTECCSRQDLAVQANPQKDNVSIAVQTHLPVQDQAVQTIKEEITTPNIPMPNIPNSVGHIKPKKRKLSSLSSSTTTRQESSISSSLLEATSNPIASQSSKSICTVDEYQLDDSILNSEVYKIYCRNEDPKEAMEQIKKLDSYMWSTEPGLPFPKEADLKRCFEDALKNLLRRGRSKWERIKKFLENKIYIGDITDITFSLTVDDKPRKTDIDDIMFKCYTRIEILLPNGFEFWYIKNFEGGVGVSKWYRAASHSYNNYGDNLVRLNIIGLTNIMIEQYYQEDYLKRNNVKIPWLDFAEDLLRQDLKRFYPDNVKPRRVDFYFEEVNFDTMIEVTATVDLRSVDESIKRSDFDSYQGYINAQKSICRFPTFKTYRGKSTRQIKSKNTISKNKKEEMRKEAKKAACIECFKDRLGYTDFSDISIDYLGRPITT